MQECLLFFRPLVYHLAGNLLFLAIFYSKEIDFLLVISALFGEATCIIWCGLSHLNVLFLPSVTSLLIAEVSFMHSVQPPPPF